MSMAMAPSIRFAMNGYLRKRRPSLVRSWYLPTLIFASGALRLISYIQTI